MRGNDQLAIINADIMSFADGMWRTTGTGIYLAGGVIQRIGSAADILAMAKDRNTTLLDYRLLPGATCFPAFMDSHLHLDLYGSALLSIDLSGASSLEEALARIRNAGKPDSGNWIRGDGWDDELWHHAPRRQDLDELYHESPVVLKRKDYHSLWLNTAALKAVGLWEDTTFGDDLIPRDNDGPTGILHDAAQDVALARIPDPGLEERFAGLHQAISRLLSLGIASCCNMDFGILPELEALVPAMDEEPRIRIWQAIGAENLDAAVALGLRSGFGSDFLRIGGVKFFADGSLGSRTAYMVEPWDRGHANYGYHTYTSINSLSERFHRADEHGLWIWIHAIGDRANAEVLEAFDKAGASLSKGHAHHRIEHAQFLRATDIGRFGDLGIAASVQPSHLDLDIGKLRSVFPVPHPGSYAFHSLLSAGTDLCFGSDAPVEDPDPLKGMSFAAFRERAEEEPYQPEQCISLSEALSAYTVVPQDTVGLAGVRGNLVEGQDADVVVLSHNVLRSKGPDDVRSACVAATIVNGAVAYRA